MNLSGSEVQIMQVHLQGARPPEVLHSETAQLGVAQGERLAIPDPLQSSGDMNTVARPDRTPAEMAPTTIKADIRF
ncbi:MAG TPA: hypothetical protein PLL33_05430 [Paracoccus sp. (in: a-proteobacteria)]|nr:hypothetical protein [Paracoccus sp. (in: a-proteobacteria)]